MDNLTHTLVGLMMSRAGLDRGSKGTAAMLMLAANAPDIDTYPFFYDMARYLEIHRGYTHSLLFLPLVALLPVAIVRGYLRTKPTLYDWGICILAVLSHLLLDWTNVYGIRLLMPLSDEWFRLDITSVIDPIIWLILVVATLFPNLLRMVTAEIGSSKEAGGKRAWARFAVILLLGYEGWRWTAHNNATEQLNALLYKGEPARHVYAFPDSFGTFHWRGLVETESSYYEVPMEFSGRFTMFNAEQEYKARKPKAVDLVRNVRAFQVFEDFNQVPFWQISPLVDETQVELMDLRFGSFHEPGLSATAIVKADDSVSDVNFGFGR